MVLGKLPMLLIWVLVQHRPTVLAVDVCCLNIFSLVNHFSLLSPSGRQPGIG